LKINRVYYIQLWHSSLLVVLTSGYHNMTLFLNLATTFYLFNIFSIFYSSTLSTSIGFISSIFYPSTSSLYFTTQLTFTIRWILMRVGSLSLTMFINITSKLTCYFVSFFTSLSLKTRSFMLKITSLPFFYTSVSFLSLSVCLFISLCALFDTISFSS